MCSFHIVEVIFSQGGISCQWDYLYCDPIMFSSLLPQLKRDPGALWDFGARSPKMVFLNKSTRTEEAWVKEGSLTGDTSIFLLSGAIVLTGATSVSDCWNCSVTKADDCSFRIILEFPSTSKKKKPYWLQVSKIRQHSLSVAKLLICSLQASQLLCLQNHQVHLVLCKEKCQIHWWVETELIFCRSYYKEVGGLLTIWLEVI